MARTEAMSDDQTLQVEAPGSTPEPEHAEVALGAQIATFRQMQGMSLRTLAAAAGVSPGFLSLLERGKTNASVGSLRKIAGALGVSPAALLDPRHGYTRGVLRAANRPHIALDGADKYVLALPPLKNLEVYSGVFAPGGTTGPEPYAHGKAQEVFIVTSGEVVFELGDESYRMHVGDSIEFLSSVPHRVINDTDLPAEVIWVCSPATPVTIGADQESRPHGAV